MRYFKLLKELLVVLVVIVIIPTKSYSVTKNKITADQVEPKLRKTLVNDGYFKKEEIDKFFNQGYVIVRELYNKNEIKDIAKYVERLEHEAKKLAKSRIGNVHFKGAQFIFDKINNKIKIHEIQWVGNIEPKLLKYGRKKELTCRVAQLLNSNEADHLLNHIYFKLPKNESGFTWHQDIQKRRHFDPYWEDINMYGSFVKVIIAIDPMTPSNGPIIIVPELPIAGDLYLDKINPEQIAKLVNLNKAFPLTLSPGDAIFIHPYLVHGNTPNTSSQKRRIFINGFSYPGANKNLYSEKNIIKRIKLR